MRSFIRFQHTSVASYNTLPGTPPTLGTAPAAQAVAAAAEAVTTKAARLVVPLAVVLCDRLGLVLLALLEVAGAVLAAADGRVLEEDLEGLAAGKQRHDVAGLPADVEAG